MDLTDRLARAADTLDQASDHYRGRSIVSPERRTHAVATRVAALVIVAAGVAGLLLVRSNTGRTVGAAASSDTAGVLPRLLLPQRPLTIGQKTYAVEPAGGQDYRLPNEPDAAFSYVSFVEGDRPRDGLASLTLRTGTISELGLPEQRLGSCAVSEVQVRGHRAIRIDDLALGSGSPSGVVYFMWQETPTVAALFEMHPAGSADALALVNELEVVDEGQWTEARTRMVAAGEFVTDPENHDAIWSASGWFEFSRNDPTSTAPSGVTATTTPLRGTCVLPAPS